MEQSSTRTVPYWLGDQNVIHITEQPGQEGRTEIVAETIAEYKRAAQAPKAETL